MKSYLYNLWPWGFFFTVFVFSYVRIFFAVDFSDEAFYVSLPFSFFKGAQPFVDEVFPQQFSALLMKPMIGVYEGIGLSTQGIVLYFRQIYFFIASVTAFMLLGRVRKNTTVVQACAIAALLFLFQPFSLPTMSYNNMGFLFTFLGILCCFSATRIGNATGALCFGVGTFSYPPLIVVVLFHFFTTYHNSRILKRWPNFWNYLISMIVVGIVFTVVLFDIGFEPILNTYRTISRWQIWTFDGPKYLHIFKQLPTELRVVLLLNSLLVAGLSFALRVDRQSLYRGLKILLSLDICLTTLYYFTTNSIYLFEYLGVSTLPIAVVVFWHRYSMQVPKVLSLPIQLWILGTAMGFIMAMASANGLINSGFGFFIALTGIMILLLEDPPAEKPLNWAIGIQWLPWVTVFASLAGSLYMKAYHDDVPVWRLQTRVTTGPYAGLFTSKDKAQFLTEISDLVQVHGGDSQNVLFIDEFPAGYLIADLKPFTPAIWIFGANNTFSTIDRNYYIEYYKNKKQVPDLVFDFKQIFLRRGRMIDINSEGDILREYLYSQGYEIIFENQYVKILKKTKV